MIDSPLKVEKESDTSCATLRLSLNMRCFVDWNPEKQNHEAHGPKGAIPHMLSHESLIKGKIGKVEIEKVAP